MQAVRANPTCSCTAAQPRTALPLLLLLLCLPAQPLAHAAVRQAMAMDPGLVSPPRSRLVRQPLTSAGAAARASIPAFDTWRQRSKATVAAATRHTTHGQGSVMEGNGVGQLLGSSKGQQQQQQPGTIGHTEAPKHLHAARCHALVAAGVCTLYRAKKPALTLLQPRNARLSKAASSAASACTSASVTAVLLMSSRCKAGNASVR